MATIKRAVLKKVIKECLREILLEEDFITECFVQVLREGVENISQGKQQLKEQFVPKQEPQKPNPNFKTELGKNPSFTKTVKEYSRALAPKDKVMQDIFADTALTTLQEQNANGHISPSVPPPVARGNGLAMPDRAEQIVSQTKPEDLFTGAENWASIAFAPPKKI